MSRQECAICGKGVPYSGDYLHSEFEECPADCPCREFCRHDELARARAEAFEECARIAKACADERRRQLAAGGRSERVNDALFGKLTEASRIEDLIRRRAKP